MIAYLILILAVCSRFLPHWLQTPAWGVTALGGGLLFFGSRLRPGRRWQALLAIPAIALSDYLLTTVVYGFDFQWSSYVLSWLWYAAVAAGGAALLWRRRYVLRVGAAALLSSTGFFLLSNAQVWWSSGMYPHSAAGLGASYAAGLPFYRNDAASTLLLSAVLFGMPALARIIAARLSASRNGGVAA